MKDLKCIVVGVDYSECSDNALREAARIASWHDARLICFHVFEEEIMEDFRKHYELDSEEVLVNAREHLARHVESVLLRADAETKVVIGYPFKEVLREVEESKADLLVLGSRGHRQKDSRRSGVFAARCIRKAPVEVMLVRQHQARPFESIVACIDFSETSRIAARRALEIARQDGASVEFLHVLATPLVADGSNLGPGMFMTALDTEPIVESCEANLKTWVEELTGEDPVGVMVTCVVKEGISPSNVLIEHLSEGGADLAVLGTRGRTGLRSLLLGTTAERLIHEAPCSTLAIKPEGFRYEVS